MARRVQLRRGTAAQHDAFTGALAEVTVDTDTGIARVHNGSTPGGSEIATELNPRWNGARGNGTTDDTAAWQDTLDQARELGGAIIKGRGRFRITEPLEYLADATASPGFSLLGRRMTFVNEVEDGPMIRLYQEATHQFLHSCYLGGFKVEGEGSPYDSSLIELGAVRGLVIEDIQADDLTGDVIKVKQTLGDGDLSAEVRIARVQGTNCAGRIVNMTTDEGEASLAGWDIQQCLAQQCGGGFLLRGLGGRAKNNAVALSTTYPDFEFPDQGVTNQAWDVTENWCEAGEVGAFLIPTLILSRFKRNHIIYNLSNGGPYGFRLGQASGRQFQAEFRHNRFVVHASIVPFTAYDVLATCYDVEIEDTGWQQISGSQTKYADAGARTVIRESASESSGGTTLAPTRQAAVVSASTSHTPNLFNGAHQRITISSGSAFTINAPSGGVSDGREFEMTLLNDSGGTVTLTFDAVYATTGLTQLLGGQRAVGRFMYDASSAVWVLRSAWLIV